MTSSATTAMFVAMSEARSAATVGPPIQKNGTAHQASTASM